MTADGNGAPFKVSLRDLPLPVRLVLSLFLIGVGGGYFTALMQLHFQHASPGQPLPTPNDVVEIFSGVENWPIAKPAPPPPASKVESLIMAPENLPHNGSGTMAFAFFGTDKKPVPPEKRPFREGERLALQSWIHMPDEQRKDAFDSDAMPRPTSLAKQPITKDYVDDDKIKVQSIIHDRCGKCHQTDNQTGKKALWEYSDFAEVLEVPTVDHTSRQMSLESLTQTTHLHLLSFCMLWMLTGLIFAFSSYRKWLRCILAPLVLLAQLADVSFWWLARLTDWPPSMHNGIGPYFALAIIGTGALVAVGLFLQIVLSLLDMYRWPGRVALLVLFIAAVAGAAVLTPSVRTYLKNEGAPPAAPAAPQKT
ncbi:MAG TPA: hypothetical protein VMS17_27075 [Gemmataceae bacterium]|nr:hypothetical protein [Gemmataceae bacterium]